MPKLDVHSRNRCLHCQTIVRFDVPANGSHYIQVIADKEQMGVTFVECPNCRRIIVTIEKLQHVQSVGYQPNSEYIVWPLSSGRPPAPDEVPINIAQDYNEASLVLPFSAKASAALSRRCLQAVLRDAAKTAQKDLSNQIDEVLPSLPTYISDNLDAIRNIGNFAAHEQKSKSTGTIMDIEVGEAEWNLDVLDSLFDFYYVRPKIEEEKRNKLEQKLSEAGKPPLKKP